MHSEINFILYRICIFFIVTLSRWKVLTSDFVDVTARGLLLVWFLHNSYIRNLLFYSYLLSKNPFITQWVIYIHYQAFQSFSVGLSAPLAP